VSNHGGGFRDQSHSDEEPVPSGAGEVKRGNLCMEQGQVRGRLFEGSASSKNGLSARFPQVGRKSPSGNRGSKSDGRPFFRERTELGLSGLWTVPGASGQKAGDPWDHFDGKFNNR